MAKAYLIAHIRVHDKEKFAEFAAMAGPSIAQYGGRVLAKGPHADHREGDLRGVVMLIEFDIWKRPRPSTNRTNIPQPKPSVRWPPRLTFY